MPCIEFSCDGLKEGDDVMNRFFGVMVAAVLLSISGMGVVHARTPVPVIQFGNQPWTVPEGKVFTENEVREGIIKAVQTYRARRGLDWQIDSDTPGKLDASGTIRHGKHTVRVSITYTPSTFSVVYLGSDNMDAQTVDGGTMLIHPNYNYWVGSLVKYIRAQLGRT
jgi:hypothetical protein